MPSVYLGGPAAPKRTLRDILEATARANPRAAAIDDGHRVLDYAALLREVDALGAMLSASGIGHRDRIGIRVPSGTADLYVSILATLSIGAAYVPVDADDPEERADMVFGEAGVCAVIGAERAVTLASTPPKRIGPRLPGPNDDAWIIFTSGSTGKPKGVAVSTAAPPRSSTPRRGCSCRTSPLGHARPCARRPVRRLRRLLRGDVAGLAARRLPGARTALAGPLRVPTSATGSSSSRISVVSTVPTLAALWPSEQLHGVRLLILGGEACPEKLAHRLARGVHRGLEHLRPHRDDRRRLRRADAQPTSRCASACRSTAGTSPSSTRRPASPWRPAASASW